MSQQVGTRYARALQGRAFTPVYVVSFEGIAARFSNVKVTDPLGPTSELVQTLQGSGAQITISEGRSSYGNLQFSILDLNQQVTKLASSYVLANRVVTVKAGMRGMSEADFATVYTGRILNYKLDGSNVVWSFEAVGLLKDTKTNIFTAATKLVGAIGTGTTTINVGTTAGFPTSTAGVGYLLIEKEAISYTGVTATSFTGCSRAQLGSVAAAHSDKTDVVNFIVLQGNPVTIALQLMLSTGNGTNGPYDVLPACAGLAIPQASVDVTSFEAQRDRWVQSWVFRFEESETVPGKDFIESQIWQVINAYPTQTATGLIGFHIYAPPLPSTIAQFIDDDVLVGAPSFDGQVFSRNFYNEFDLSYDWLWTQAEFLSRDLYEDSTSQVTYGQVKTKTIQARGLRSSLMVPSKIASIPLRFLKRFSNPSPIIGAKCLYSTRLLEVGDVIPFSSAFLPNLQSGKLGVSGRLYEVVQVEPLFIEGTQRYTLLDTGASYGKRYGAISPSTKPPVSFPVYSLANAVQRNYCFTSRKLTPTSGMMGDGSDGYYITF